MICPITKQECLMEKCEWFNDEKSTCHVKAIAENIEALLLSDLQDKLEREG